MLPMLTLAAEGSITDFNWLNALVGIVVFVSGLLILSRTVWPKITTALDARDEKILEEINSAEDARKRANEALKEYEASLVQARAEANQLIEQTKAEQSRLAAQLKAESEKEAQALVAEARRNIEAAKKAAITEVYAEATYIATAVASRILERELNAEDQRKLVDESLSAFSSSSA